ncbi:MAG: hypothetical protein H0V64_04445 [Geodermatophilaceae bacterium]|nr:hypothetical protein [Geodermatophilaceae bacterium]
MHLRLEDETELRGYVGDYTPDQKLENRELTIEGPKLQMKVKNSIGWTELSDWSSVSVRGDSVSWIKVTYVADADGAVVPSRQLTSGAS